MNASMQCNNKCLASGRSKQRMIDAQNIIQFMQVPVLHDALLHPAPVNMLSQLSSAVIMDKEVQEHIKELIQIASTC